MVDALSRMLEKILTMLGVVVATILYLAILVAAPIVGMIVAAVITFMMLVALATWIGIIAAKKMANRMKR